MSVIKTDAWLLDSWDDPIKICTKLEKYFHEVSSDEIYRYLVMHGMYPPFLKNGRNLIETLKNNGIWKLIQKEEKKLKQLWNGPNIPVFIFPSDPNNEELRMNFNSKSGLAFSDKLFLFVSENNSKDEIRALFTHEYNHVCRLNKFKKKEKDYVLLDTIILEGLAENAVFEQWSDKYTANWTTYYSDEELKEMWKRLILPLNHLPKQHPRHQELLYGTRLYPKMAGYGVGYYLVKKYVNEQELTSKELLQIPSAEIAQVKQSENRQI